MVAVTKMWDTPLARYRLGSVLIWVGVLTWVPYIFLRVTDIDPSPLWFLPFHLVGVIGGSRLRSFARKEMGIKPARRNPWRVLGHGLIWAGVGVWAIYFYLKLIAGASVDAIDFLPYHLAGVLSGIVFLLTSYLVSRKNDIKV